MTGGTAAIYSCWIEKTLCSGGGLLSCVSKCVVECEYVFIHECTNEVCVHTCVHVNVCESVHMCICVRAFVCMYM